MVMPQLTFRTHAPTSSTVCYTVSDAHAHAAPVPQVLHSINLVIRGVIATVALTFVAAQGRLLSRLYDPLGLESMVQTLISTTIGQSFGNDDARWWVPMLVAGGIVWACSRRSSREESLLIIRGLGIQTSTSSASYLSTPTTRFIPTSQVQDIFIHEAFIGFSVKFYLAVIVEGEEESVVVFPKLLPRREVLEEVWRGSRSVLGWTKG